MEKRAKLILFFIYSLAVMTVILASLLFNNISDAISLLSATVVLILTVIVGRITKEKINPLAIIFPIFIIIIIGLLPSPSRPPLAARDNAIIKKYLDDIRTVSAVYYNNAKDSFIGLDQDIEYASLRKEVEDVYKKARVENFYSAQISEKIFCAKARLFTPYSGNAIIADIYWCVDSKGSGETTDQYCTPAKPYCAE